MQEYEKFISEIKEILDKVEFFMDEGNFEAGFEVIEPKLREFLSFPKEVRLMLGDREEIVGMYTKASTLLSLMGATDLKKYAKVFDIDLCEEYALSIAHFVEDASLTKEEDVSLHYELLKIAKQLLEIAIIVTEKASSLISLGAVYCDLSRMEFLLGNIAEAIQLSKEAIRILEKAKLIDANPFVLNNLAVAFLRLSKLEIRMGNKTEAQELIIEAIKNLKEALKIESGDSEVLGNLGIAFLELSKIDIEKRDFWLNEALLYLEKARKNFNNEFNILINLSSVFLNLSKAEVSVGNIEKAKHFITKAIDILLDAKKVRKEDIDMLVNLGLAFLNLSRIEVALGNVSTAKNLLSKAVINLYEAKQIANNDPDTLNRLGSAFVGLAEAEVTLGNLYKAEKLLSVAVNYLEKAKRRVPKDFYTLNNLGLAYLHLSKLKVAFANLKEAEKFLYKSREVFQRTLNLSDDHFYVLNNYASVLLDLAKIKIEFKKWREAELLLQETISFLEKAKKSSKNDFNVLNNLGLAYLELLLLKRYFGSQEEVKYLFNRAITNLRQAMKVVPKDFYVLNNLGLAFLNLLRAAKQIYDDREHIERIFFEAFEIYNLATEVSGGDFRILNNFMLLLLETAGQNLKLPSNVLVLLNSYIRNIVLTVDYSAHSNNIHFVSKLSKNWLKLSLKLMENKNVDENAVVNFIETVKSCFTKSLLLEKFLINEDVHEKLRKKIEKLREISWRIESGMLSEKYGDLFELGNIRKKDILLKEIIRELREKANFFDIKATEILEEHLSNDAAAVYLIYLPDEGKLYSIVIYKSEGKLKVLSKAISTCSRLQKYLSVSANKDSLMELVDMISPLDSKKVLEESLEIQNHLLFFTEVLPKEVKHLYILPFGILNLINFHALCTKEGSLLLERFTISYLPSIYFLRTAYEELKSGKSVIFAYEPSREKIFYEEAKVIEKVLSELWSVSYFEDPDVFSVKEALQDNFRVVYFSTHGKGGEEKPLNSFIELKESFLTVPDIMESNFTSDLTILSACELNLTFSKSVDDSSEFERTMLVAGSRNVISAIRDVYAKHTKEFMENLIKEYLNNVKKKVQRPAAEAFRTVALKLYKENPYNTVWKSFRLAGIG